MKIVLNTSPIIFLSKVDSLKLLAEVSDEIYTPAAVVNELHEVTPPPFIKAATLSAVGAAYVQGALGRLHRRTESDYSGAGNSGRLRRSG